MAAIIPVKVKTYKHWSVKDVVTWANHSFESQEISLIFLDNGINGQILHKIKEQHLREDYGVEDEQTIELIMLHIKKLKYEYQMGMNI